MATSSLKKSFVISSKKEADAFAKLFTQEPQPLREIEFSIVSKEEMAKIIHATLGKTK